MADAAQPGSPGKIVKYLICGCGSTGYNVVEELLKETDSILILDRDEKRVEDLRDQKYDAIVRDMQEPNAFDDLPVPEVIFVLSNDKDANLSAVRTAKAKYPPAHVIARATDPVGKDMLESAGADVVLYPQEVIAKTAVHHIRRLSASRIARRLSALLGSWEGTLGIVTHTNPDPDSVSSAMALAAIAHDASGGKLVSRILYDGNIGHQENRAFVNLLDIKMEKISPEILAACEHLALVDSTAPGSNNALGKDARVNIIIDHHKNGTHDTTKVEFVDIRPGMGATASIMTQYLQELDLPVDTKVATALLYGIRADTRDFRRNITPQDLNYAAFLLPLTDRDILDKIMSPSVSQETLDVLGNAIRGREVVSGYLFTNVGYLRNRDAVPQAADALINLEGVNTAIVYGITDINIIFSARNRDIRIHIGKVLEEAFAGIGEAGGHATMAAAAIPLTYFSMVKEKEELLDLIIEPILKKIRRIVGLENEAKHEV
ncbi:MAG: DHH family phosphoesterase [Methanofollis sp.]|uniref:DHH family phosphoesterase n=1 Tax=Methanofollis sp. TaxID=2052835 RepID=UPI00261F3422|nr:DHH family phosphoesterase [Methanofollis sp.]MDD4255219.1 DHH family phosphoesterase [Methanofollis sp.]